MALPEHFLILYGYLLLFAWIFLGQLGTPLPATPVLLTAGALSAEHELKFPLALLAGIIACLAADSAWFFTGRRFGSYVLRFLCKLSLEPAVCVNRTRDSFHNRRGLTLIIAKFVPGLATLTASVAGGEGMEISRFLAFDTLGATLWVSTLLTAGLFFGDVLKRNAHFLDWIGQFSGALLLLGILGFIAGRLVRRRMVSNQLDALRLDPEELKRQLDAGEEIYIVDLRHPIEYIPDPFTLPGAHLITPKDLEERHQEIPRNCDVVLFCTCPSEATAAKTAKTLHNLGIERVHPLRGGYPEWKRRGFPLEAIDPALTSRN
jgi:membrane protein DedA with SNARE-associated domain/rhodanese-related sulfurtransferase